MSGIDVVVAGVDAPVVLHGEDPSARPRHHTEVGRLARHDEEALEEVLHADALDVVADPLVEDRAEELPHRLGRYRALRYTAARRSLHHGEELHPLNVLVDEEPIDLARVSGGQRVQRAEHVRLDAARRAAGEAPASPVRGSAARAGRDEKHCAGSPDRRC